MSDELVKQESGAFMVQGLTEQVNAIHLAMKKSMKVDVHYGLIPGCGSKPALYKSGAEKLLFMFRLFPKFQVDVEDLGNNHREYTVTSSLFDKNGNFCGEGVGSCSTMETKYRYRKGGKACPECGNVGSIFNGKAQYGGGYFCASGKGGCGKSWKEGTAIAKQIDGQKVERIENPDLADQYNTILKMAKKRSLVDVTLTATAASDIFEQDLEEYGEAELEALQEERKQKGMKPETTAPEQKTEKKSEPKKETKKAAKKDTAPEKEEKVSESTEAMTLPEWKNASNGQEDVAKWWGTMHAVAKEGLGEKQFRMLENYIADVHSVKL